MEFKGTPAPWSITSKGDKRYQVNNGFIDVWNLAEIEYDEMIANAQLIAHAPEMLEMLDTVLNDYYNIIPQSEARDNRMRQINDLLTRATTI